MFFYIYFNFFLLFLIAFQNFFYFTIIIIVSARFSWLCGILSFSLWPRSPAIPFNLFFPMSGCCHWRQTTYSSIHTIFTNNNNNFFNWNYTVNNYNVFPPPDIYIVASSPLFYFYAKHRNDEIVPDVVDFIKKKPTNNKNINVEKQNFHLLWNYNLKNSCDRRTNRQTEIDRVLLQ